MVYILSGEPQRERTTCLDDLRGSARPRVAVAGRMRFRFGKPGVGKRDAARRGLPVNLI